VVAKEARSGRLVRQWLAEDPPAQPPYDLGERSLFVAYYASAELSCHMSLRYPTLAGATLPLP
jgi:hypothetical protein